MVFETTAAARPDLRVIERFAARTSDPLSLCTGNRRVRRRQRLYR